MKLYEISGNTKYDFSCIYLWTNLVNGKKYVGQAQSFYNRMGQYKYGKFNKHLQYAIKKYGIDNFDITILERDIPFEFLDEREQYWLDYYQSYFDINGYNICQHAGTTRGFKHSSKTKQLLREKAKRRFEDPAERAKVQGENNGMYGKKHTEEWCKQHSDWLKNKWATNKEYREYISEKSRGKNNYFYGKRYFGVENGNAKSVRCVELNKIYTTVKEAAKRHNISRQNITHVLRGNQKTAGGYHWEYA